MQSEHYLSVALFPWVEYIEVDSTTEQTPLCHWKHRIGSKMKIEELVNIFFYYFNKLLAAYFEDNLLAKLKKSSVPCV